jgi:FMN phosphatase YigB (HAD superfamily)
MNLIEELKIAHIPMLTHNELGSIKVAAIDCDGTIYDYLENDEMTEMKMNRDYYRRSGLFVMNNMHVNEEIAHTVVTFLTSSDGGTSSGLAKIFFMTKPEVTDFTWDMDANKVIGRHIPQAISIWAMRNMGIYTVLLTSAPKVWREPAVSHCGLKGAFYREIDRGMYSSKTKALEALAWEFDPAHTVSIGNQIETDILPAHELGMRVYHVTPERTLPDLVFGK